ncbi:MAG TPA: diacylglycerol kinase [Aquabacterium sp.]|uniref:diacylglycerol kinase n=1 Tax=Aquabacterium sp. TaxID=1872578 RepID=UPI002E2EDF8F|nr:diacylglycerol kinase [Aquabacterium sp.]HEX5356636.1 diacylglycerol kinase [Aquabacterium sp.]
MKGHRFIDRLGFAWAGLCAAWRLEKSIKTHSMAAAGVVVLLMTARAPAIWWAIMALTIALVVATELLNTAIEALADHLHPQQHEAIKLTKDVAAGAVLVASLLALVVGVAFFVDQLWPLLSGWLRPMRPA